MIVIVAVALIGLIVATVALATYIAILIVGGFNNTRGR
jgi:hypothetical protein